MDQRSCRIGGRWNIPRGRSSVLALQGYTGNILSPTNAKPSSDPTVTRGFGILDAFGNEQVLYQDLANRFGLPPGVTQNNPTGIATTDGTNFWGTGNVTGTSSEAAGTLFYNAQYSPTQVELQNYIQAAAEARIINGTLYVVVPGGGIYNFVDPAKQRCGGSIALRSGCAQPGGASGFAQPVPQLGRDL